MPWIKNMLDRSGETKNWVCILMTQKNTSILCLGCSPKKKLVFGIFVEQKVLPSPVPCLKIIGNFFRGFGLSVLFTEAGEVFNSFKKDYSARFTRHAGWKQLNLIWVILDLKQTFVSRKVLLLITMSTAMSYFHFKAMTLMYHRFLYTCMKASRLSSFGIHEMIGWWANPLPHFEEESYPDALWDWNIDLHLP